MLKRIIKKLIKNDNKQDQLRLIYNSVKTISPNLLLEEMKMRNNGSPDGFSFPPSKLIFTVIAIPWVSEFYKSGKIIFDDMLKTFDNNGINLKDRSNILDFGCGCGRVIRHFAATKKFNLYGSDLNYNLIDWCNNNLFFGKFNTNNLLPPLKYEDDFFELVYARSVFTHLGSEAQLEWINEVRRILKPSGLFYFTTHGKNTISPLSIDEKNRFNDNEIVLHNDFGEGDNKYSSYQSYKWTTNNLLNGFELVEFKEGSEKPHLRQDVYILRKL